MVILVIGGVGYIGLYMVVVLLECGEEVVVLDNLQIGYCEVLFGGKLYEGDLCDKVFLVKLFVENFIDVVIYFVVNLLVGESMKDLVKYYDNNVFGMLCLLEVMNVVNVCWIVFFLIVVIYGEFEKVLIEESDCIEFMNVYGEMKLMMECMMFWFDKVQEIKYVFLCYFNVVGVYDSGKIGEDYQLESYLILFVL